MSDKNDSKVFGVVMDIDIIDRLDRLFYTRKIDGTIKSKSEFIKEIFTEYLEVKGF